ncbi:hypothetical protein C1645_829068 [Glomus cerebriforme]|uniref:Uncharacterized protein n=1 Tax=Glomus cerebriforme TaxID=658196 RepID=A0A397S9P8_9GLOM|nr:hypothetical protein C1645_836966 [Glomus cerebriforme]RIA86556.1 hypothetical protein C1645_829068 [Glomus cerebriforme]
MSYSSLPTEPEHAATAIGRTDLSTRTLYGGPFMVPNHDVSSISPPTTPTGSQLRRSSKIGRSSGEIKRQSIMSKLSSKYKLVSPENEPQHIKIVMPLPSQLSKDLKDEQETFPIHHDNKTLSEILKMPWIDEDNKFSKKFWLIFVIGFLIFFGSGFMHISSREH